MVHVRLARIFGRAVRTFALYQEERHYWSFADYGTVVDVVRKLYARSVLEFGPGSSTLALIEGGASTIYTLEDDPVWTPPARDRLANHWQVARLIAYTWSDPLVVEQVDREFDLALIDGPADTTRRPACIEYALARCRAVLVALECAQGDTFLRDACIRLAEKHGRAIEIMETGPLAGAFALLT